MCSTSSISLVVFFHLLICFVNGLTELEEYNKKRSEASSKCAGNTKRVGLGPLKQKLWEEVDPTFYLMPGYKSSILPVGQLPMPYRVDGQKATYTNVEYLGTGATRLTSKGVRGVTIAPLLYDMPGGTDRLGKVYFYHISAGDRRLLSEIDHFICDPNFKAEHALVVSGACLGNKEGPFANYQMMISYGQDRMFLVIVYGTIIPNTADKTSHYIQPGDLLNRRSPWKINMRKPILVYELTALNGQYTYKEGPCEKLPGQIPRANMEERDLDRQRRKWLESFKKKSTELYRQGEALQSNLRKLQRQQRKKGAAVMTKGEQFEVKGIANDLVHFRHTQNATQFAIDTLNILLTRFKTP